MRRQYEAYADNGRDYITFIFYSESRANSRANLEDARNHYKRKHGRYINVLRTYRVDID